MFKILFIRFVVNKNLETSNSQKNLMINNLMKDVGHNFKVFNDFMVKKSANMRVRISKYNFSDRTKTIG